MRYCLTHGLEGSGADIEYKILKEGEHGYILAFFEDAFCLPKSIFSDNIIKQNCICILRNELRRLICRD